MKQKYRIILLTLLLIITIGICVQYASADRWEYPVPSEIASEPEEYNGEAILLFVDVEKIDTSNDQLYVKQFPHHVHIELIDRDIIQQLESGASIQVYGIFNSQTQNIIAEEIVIDRRGTKDSQYLYVTSILGIVLTIGVFFKYWRVDIRTLTFKSDGDN